MDSVKDRNSRITDAILARYLKEHEKAGIEPVTCRDTDAFVSVCLSAQKKQLLPFGTVEKIFRKALDKSPAMVYNK